MSYTRSVFEYTKLRKEFGRQPLFQAVPAVIIDSIPEDKTMQKYYGLRNPVHRDVQATLPQSQHDCNTKRVLMTDTSINHYEGGWPREIHPESEEMTSRYRRRIQHEESYVESIFKLAPTIKHCLDQNNAIEMYKTYFVDMLPQECVETREIKLANIFRDKQKRSIASIVWTVEHVPKLAVSHYPFGEAVTEITNPKIQSSITTDGIMNEYPHNTFIWDIQNESAPLQTFNHEYPCWRLAGSPVDADILVGGMENGTVNIFDLRHGPHSVSSSSVYHSHFKPITGVLFITSRSMTEFFTCAPDGQCLWWDLRNLSEPTDRLFMSVRMGLKDKPSMANAEGMSCIQFDKNMPTRFLGGTETGLVINGNRMGKSHNEILTNYWKAHDGPVRAVHRSPATMRMFITCGDFTVRIWSEEVRTEPIILAKPYCNQVTDVCWAPHRLSGYMSVCAGGRFHYWDLLRNYKARSAYLQVSQYRLTKLAPHTEGELVTVGDHNGSMFLLRLSENMVVSGGNDKVLVSQMYERETRREHILDNRMKEIHLKQRLEEEALAGAQDEDKVETVEELSEEEILAAAEEKYFEIVRKQMEEFGITPET